MIGAFSVTQVWLRSFILLPSLSSFCTLKHIHLYIFFLLRTRFSSPPDVRPHPSSHIRSLLSHPHQPYYIPVDPNRHRSRERHWQRQSCGRHVTHRPTERFLRKSLVVHIFVYGCTCMGVHARCASCEGSAEKGKCACLGCICTQMV